MDIIFPFLSTNDCFGHISKVVLLCISGIPAFAFISNEKSMVQIPHTNVCHLILETTILNYCRA